MTPLAVTAYTATTAVGAGIGALRDAIAAGRTGLVPETHGALATWVGRVPGLDDASLPQAYAAGSASFDSRIARLAWIALREDGFLDAAKETIARVGRSRVGVFVGTSTSTIAESERAYARIRDGIADDAVLAQPHLHHLHAIADFVAHVLGTAGPSITVSTACSSSAKVFAQAARMIDAGIVDAAVVGGIDSLAASTLFGFHALGLVSREACRPFDARRDGINIGEGAAFALLERTSDDERDAPLFVGYGESSDAHHMSAPHPDGLGARRAIVDALASASLSASAVDYVNLHGTATPKNDAVEARVVAALFDARTKASSTKGWTGHTLGAAGAVEAVVALVALRDGIVPGTLNAAVPDDDAAPQVRFANEAAPLRIALSHAFAFGGNNCVLAFARDARGLAEAQA